VVIFDRTEGKTWKKKLFCRKEISAGIADHPAQFPVTVWGGRGNNLKEKSLNYYTFGDE